MARELFDPVDAALDSMTLLRDVVCDAKCEQRSESFKLERRTKSSFTDLSATLKSADCPTYTPRNEVVARQRPFDSGRGHQVASRRSCAASRRISTRMLPRRC